MTTITRALKRDNLRIVGYFAFWFFLATTSFLLNVFNVDWNYNSKWFGILVVLVTGTLQGSVFELVVMATTTAVIGGHRRRTRHAKFDHLTMIMNYNLLAVSEDDIDETYRIMYEAYMGNLCENFSMVLVSATNTSGLKNYELRVRDQHRLEIYKQLMKEGHAFATGQYNSVDKLRLRYVWLKYVNVDKRTFLNEFLDAICQRFSNEFMCVHRVSRVLKKCGQYQDLMLLSEGDKRAFSYTDPSYYGKLARPYGQPLFHDSPDVDNIHGRCFDYTLVLDGDTGLSEGSAYELMSIAAAYPERGIIQPAIKMEVKEDDTVYMHLEDIRQQVNEPITNALTDLLGQSGFYGKGLIRNWVYVDNIIGNRRNYIERIPIDVLSHDTFEAACMRPLYVSSVALLEAPCLNYVTWDMRETRWNKGEVLLAMYFWPNTFGKLMRYLQTKLHGLECNHTRLRTPSQFDFVSAYIAHSALRNMFMKPLLLIYLLIHMFVRLRFPFIPICTIMFLILIYPKMAVYNGYNFKKIAIELIASTFQFTPEAFVGCWRVFMAVRGNLDIHARWIPQRAVEEEFRRSNPLSSSFRHLWLFSATAVMLTGGVTFLDQFATNRNYMMFVMIGTLFLLPLFTAVTTMTPQKVKPMTDKRRFVAVSALLVRRMSSYLRDALLQSAFAVMERLTNTAQRKPLNWRAIP